MAKERKGHPSGEEHKRHAPSRPGHGDAGDGGKHAGHRAPPHRREPEEDRPREREPEADWPMERSPADELAPDND